VKWNGSTFTDDEAGDGANFGEVAVSLCYNEFNSCLQPGI
jgi:hypothetical protein